MGNFATESVRRALVNRAGVLVLATVLTVIIGGCATAKGPLLLHPVPTSVENYKLTQGAIVFSGPDFSVSARPWDYRLVAEEFRRSGEPSPFGDNEETVGTFLFFRVGFENRSTRTLVFNPMRASLLREGETPLVPMENSDLFTFQGEDNTGTAARGKAFRRVSFDNSTTIRSGQTLERYLVFRSPDVAEKRIVLAIDGLWLDSKSFDLMFVFESFPAK